MQTGLVYDPHFLDHNTGRHVENSARLTRILAALESDRALWESLVKIQPSPASEQDIERCHASHLIDNIRRHCEAGERFLDADTAVSRESYDVALLAAGAGLAAVDQVVTGQLQNAFALVRPPGHHATPSRAMGFCLFNNAAIAARYAQERYGVERVAIIDWDVHHGNGTQDIFYSDPTVFYFSAHQYPYYPGTGSHSETGEGKGEGYTLNIPLAAGTPGKTHRELIAQAIVEIGRRLPPDLVIISAGFDAHSQDPLGGMLLEDADFRELTCRAMELADHGGGKVVSILEGGYNLNTLGQTVKTHIEGLSGGIEEEQATARDEQSSIRSQSVDQRPDPFSGISQSASDFKKRSD